MKPLRTLFLLFVSLLATRSSQLLAANVYLYIGPTGQTLYGRVEETAGSFVAFALTEGTGGAKGKYYATEASLVAAGLDTAGTFVLTVHAGTPSTSAEDPIVAFDGAFGWTGSAVDPGSSGGSSGTAAQINNARVAESRVVNLSRRADGTTVAVRPIRLRPSEVQVWWLNTAPIAGGAWVDDVTGVTTSDLTKVEVEGGLNRDLVCLTLDSTNAVAGATYTCTGVAWFNTQKVQFKVAIEIASD